MGGRPNFFIVGAPRCGTTALFDYLRPHPNIFIPERKKPHFFAKDPAALQMLLDRGPPYATVVRTAGLGFESPTRQCAGPRREQPRAQP